MNRSWWTRVVLLVIAVIVAGVYVTPTLGRLDLEKTKFPFKQKINLGLDLQGGLYMVLGVDFNKVYKEIVVRQMDSLQGTLAERMGVAKKARLVDNAPADDPRFAVELDPAKKEEIKALIKKEFWSLRLTDEKANTIELGLGREFRNEVRERTLTQSIEVIRNRIDEFGVSEPAITSQGTDRIVVELPGIREIERAKDLIGRTAKLEFKLVDDKSIAPQELQALVTDLETKNGIAYKEGQKFSEYVSKLNDLAKGKIPEGRQIAFERTKNFNGTAVTEARIPFLLHSKADVTGEELQDAQVSMDQENQRPVVTFSLNPRGANLFGQMTGDHVHERLAVVLDNIVHSAPVIQNKIPDGRVQITLGQGDGETLMREAKDLATVLRAGALPAQLDFLEQRVVGPTLGQDSIDKGARAGVIGCLLIFVFMMFYYRWSGVVATISLILNATFILAILVGLEATLTLPGIAGIALTIGMAVDSNVIIFERIRDELMEGKSVSAAVEAGFRKAFNAIFDANITHGIVAGILMNYGTGPIRGFAAALLVGIVTTLFCAITVCKLFFDGYLGFKNHKVSKLSI